ncbi:putative lipase atg15 [Podosphaera aphanis]|nr:putative lipase atg15 [Podosphaera aphanis]
MAVKFLLPFLNLFILCFSHNLPLQQELSPNLSPLIHPFQSSPPAPGDHLFTLRHVFHHGNLKEPTFHRRYDIQDQKSALWIESELGNVQPESRDLTIKTKTTKIQRLKDRRPSVVDPMVVAAREYSQVWASTSDAWTIDDLKAPDTTDMETILTFAQMSANAYLDRLDPEDWENIHGDFNRETTIGFGWHGDGLQGYIYADETNSTVVIGFKGTTMAIWDGVGTTKNDKENDNLFFSCCCGQQGNAFYRQVCDCASGTYTCNLTCLKRNLREENRYYAAGRHLYKNVTTMYPKADIWLTGHSLGGSVAAMIGLTYGSPALTFQAVPDALPANRLGLPVPPGADPDRPSQRDYTGAFHFGHNADPIYMGTCNGATAPCSYAGYALETVCHTGQECVWDVVNTNQTRMSIMTHKITYVINNVIKKWSSVPQCYHTPECYDCVLWKEYQGNSTLTSSSLSSTSTMTKTYTRTSTCETPGWWGCLDETTTSSIPSTSMIITTTSTCKTPGWFGCLDKTTTKTGITTSTAVQTSSTTCKTPGWFGCLDILSTTSSKMFSITPLATATSTNPKFMISDDDKPTVTSRESIITAPP